MIEKLSVSILLQGKEFSPLEAEKRTGLTLKKKSECGDIGKKGKYKNKPLPYGSALLETPSNIPTDDKFSWLIEALKVNLETLYKCGADESKIYAGYFYKNQCNFMFTKQELKEIAALNIDLWVSCYDYSDED